jgi:hydrogenase maturation protein HypF
VTGIVQGVGFRPHVYALAVRLGLSGLVGNDSGGVFIEIEGAAAALDRFQAELLAAPPPLAVIERITAAPLAPIGEHTFIIVASQAQAAQRTFVAPDQALCADCRRELFDPSDRRYLYPFINCTNCGPRFTIIRATPYDRPATTMAAFALCAECRREYEDPADRRFHAQPIACPRCGPHLMWLPNADSPLVQPAAGSKPLTALDRTLNALRCALQTLAAGGVVAVKGLGGYHLACNAADDAAVARLRRRKGRVGKPLAVMAADLETARRYVEIDADEAALLTDRARPIVLLRQRAGAALAPQVAPGNAYLGVMLPYTPLHELLFHTPPHLLGPAAPMPLLIMTSGNLSEEPIIWRDDEALARLAPLVDGFLLHDRHIHIPCDDSVVRVFAGRGLPIRRGRGYAPAPLPLPAARAGLPPLLAVGADLKSSFCLAQDGYAVLSQHIGDMGNLATYTAFGHAVDHLQTLLRSEPAVIVCDAHPGYLSTRWAEEHSGGRPIVRVQHHHAHIAALLAEQGGGSAGGDSSSAAEEPIIGFSWDGTGYGADGAIWGGEVLIATCAAFVRRAHLRYIPLPGGDAAVRRPYRAALAHLWAAGVAWEGDLPPVAACPAAELALLRRQLATGWQTVPTSSMGRLFDAAAALLGVRQVVSYEAQAAVELEALLPPRIGPQLADLHRAEYAFDITTAASVTLCDAAPLLRRLTADLRAGRSQQELVVAFHAALVDLIVRLSCDLRAEIGCNCVGLSGGVFQNGALLAGAAAALHRQGFHLLVSRHAPPNDGGLALGQVAVAAAQIQHK